MLLTMEEFLAKKQKLEDDTRSLLTQFETETGIMPREVRLELVRKDLVGERRRNYQLVDVRVEVDI